MLREDHDKAHKYNKYNGPVTFVMHKHFAVLFFLQSCCGNSLLKHEVRPAKTADPTLQELPPPSLPGGGGTPLYKLYRYVLPHQAGFLHHLGLKMQNTLLILVWNRVGFSRELRECTNVFIALIPNE